MASKAQRKNNSASQPCAGKSESNVFITDHSCDNLDLKTAGFLHMNNLFSMGKEDCLVDEDVVRELRDENGRLHKLVSEKEEELRIFKKKWKTEKKELLGGGVGSENAAQKIIELSKKVRELSADLESEKNRCQVAQKKGKDLEMKLSAVMEMENSVKPAKPVEDREELQLLKEKLSMVQLKSAEERNELEALKKDLKVAQKVLAKEVGDHASFQSLLKDGSGWKGRHQQIIVLQNKVSELQQQLLSRSRQSMSTDMNESMVSSFATSIHDERHRLSLKKMEIGRREQTEKMRQELEICCQERDAIQEKHGAIKARNKVLSQDVKRLKEQIGTLLEKGKHDDELISALLREQQTLKEVNAKILDEKKSQLAYDERIARGKSAEAEKALVSQLQQEVIAQQRKVESLESELRSRPRSAAKENATLELQQLRSLKAAADAERTNLLELIKVLQQRNDDLQNQYLQSERSSSEYKRQAAELEKKLARFGQNSSRMNSSGKPKSTSSMLETENRELETKLAIREDEIGALKQVLESTLKSKEGDLLLFQRTVEETKSIFLQGMRQFREAGAR